MTHAELISRLDQAISRTDGQWEARCPAHDDRRRSLGVGTGRDGRILIMCQAGCKTDEVLHSLGLTMRDIMPEQNTQAVKPRIVATYDYKDEQCKLLYQVVRLDPKDFRIRTPDGRGGWLWSAKGVRRVLYRLPELLSSDRGVIFVEGEKDADALWRLGLTATTIAGGAGKPVDPEIVRPLVGRPVAIFPDNDHPGLALAENVAQLITGALIVKLPDGAKDVSDWIASGATAGMVRQLIGEALREVYIRDSIEGIVSELAAMPREQADETIKELERIMNGKTKGNVH